MTTMTRPSRVHDVLYFNCIENRCVASKVKFDKLKRKNAPL